MRGMGDFCVRMGKNGGILGKLEDVAKSGRGRTVGALIVMAVLLVVMAFRLVARAVCLVGMAVTLAVMMILLVEKSFCWLGRLF